MRINYIHESIEAGIIKLQYVNTDNEVTDVLTKLLSVAAHQIHKEFLMQRCHHGKRLSGEKSKKNSQRGNKRVLFKLNQFTGKYVHKLASKKLV